MSYIDTNLLPGENVTARAKIHWFIYARAVFFLLIGLCMMPGDFAPVVGTVLIAIGLYLLAKAFVFVISTELGVTTKRVIAKYGFISRQTIELNLDKIESLTVDQSIFGRIFDFGTVVVNGTGGRRAPFPFISAPLSFRRQVNEQIENFSR